MDIKTVYWLWASSVIILLSAFIPMLYFAKKDIKRYKERCDTYFESFTDVCNSSVGCLHISQIDEHKAPEIYLEIYKGSYQRILDRSMLGCCIILDSVVDSQDKQAL